MNIFEIWKEKNYIEMKLFLMESSYTYGSEKYIYNIFKISTINMNIP